MCTRPFTLSAAPAPRLRGLPLPVQLRAALGTWSTWRAARPAWTPAHTWRSATCVKSTAWTAASAQKVRVRVGVGGAMGTGGRKSTSAETLLPNTRAHAHTRVHTCAHTHMHTHVHTRAHARTHTCTHTVSASCSLPLDSPPAWPVALSLEAGPSDTVWVHSAPKEGSVGGRPGAPVALGAAGSGRLRGTRPAVAGTVFDDIAGGGCIPVSQCGCKLHGHLYTPGQEVTNACEQWWVPGRGSRRAGVPAGCGSRWAGGSQRVGGGSRA